MNTPLTRRAKARVASSLENAGRRWRYGAIDETSTLEQLRRVSAVESAEMVNGHLETAQLFSTRSELHEYVYSELFSATPAGLFLEFGVYGGASANLFSNHVRGRAIDNRYWCFDSFMGLRDSWSQIGMGTGAFSRGGAVPRLGPNCEVVVGWVEDTLDPFLASHPDPIAFCHFDLDVYPATKFALARVLPRLQTNTVLLFDEHHGYPGWQYGEFAALRETIDSQFFDYVAFDDQAAVIRMRR